LSVAEKISIENGLSDVKAGKTTTHSEVKKRYEKWLM
jgi:predicted transcriptional regulator